MARSARDNYYTNPAFCQQSEYYRPSSPLQRCSSMRVAPIGANSSSPQKPEGPIKYYEKHRYEVIEMDENEIELNNQFIRQMQIEHHQPQEQQHHMYVRQGGRYAVIPDEEVTSNIREMSPDRVRYTTMALNRDYNGNASPPSTGHLQRYTPIPAPRSKLPQASVPTVPRSKSSPTTPRKFNPVATQKLHELLTTPRKPVQRSQSVRVAPCLTPHYTPSGGGRTPMSAGQRPNVSRAQQKLNYNMCVAANTAVISPMCELPRSPPPQSVYSETTFSGKSSSSWMNLSAHLKENSNGTLAVAALMMLLCGALASGLGFYMISLVGRNYYLDLSLVSGFTCFVLGLLGFRTRTCRWLPNRNYISGYIVLSVFSLLTCTGLLLLLAVRPKPGSPLADVTSGAVCGISALSLLLASLGVLSSYCCKYPPPDNRVEHCAPGFTV